MTARLVPQEPTKEMIEAGREELPMAGVFFESDEFISELYKAMIAAAPPRLSEPTVDMLLAGERALAQIYPDSPIGHITLTAIWKAMCQALEGGK